jgi:TolB protein
MRFINVKCCRWFFALSCLVGSAVAEQVNLEVYASKFDSIPIAVLPFSARGESELGENKPWDIVADDLAFSHHFSVLRIQKVDSALFAQKNIALYIHGEYSVSAEDVSIDCFIRDATSGNLLAGKKYQGKKQQLRKISHRFSNDVVQLLFGERGVFESRILYVGDEQENKNIFIMDYDGYNSARLTNNKSINVFPTFADENTIVWTSFLRGKPDLYKGSISSGKSAIFIYSRFIDTSPAVSRIEDKITYSSSRSGNLEIYTADMDNTATTQLTFNNSIDTSPCWSPNGYQIAFTSDRSGQPQIYIMDADGANSRRLTFEGKYQDSPAWSPLGDKIAYASLADGKFDIWTIAPDGTNATKITSQPGNNTYPSWSADGNYIVFASNAAGKSDLYSIRVDGTNSKRLTFSGKARMPEWAQFD